MSPEVTFVCCVEPALLEGQTILMVESLRRWGGAHKDAPVIAVTPRRGVGLERETRAALDRLGVTYLSARGHHEYAWFNYFNKPYALVLASEHVTTRTTCWIDSDILVVGEPDAIQLAEGIDVAGCPSDREQGTACPGDEFDGVWRANCADLGLDIDRIPMVTTAADHQRIHLHWNSGVLAYRSSSPYAGAFMQTCIDMMRARNRSASPRFGLGMNEQGASSLAALRFGLAWTELPYSHNYNVNSRTHDRWYEEDELRSARLVHYHDSIWTDFYPTFAHILRQTHPEVGEWIAQQGPLRTRMSLPKKAGNRILSNYRRNRERRYLASCVAR